MLQTLLKEVNDVNGIVDVIREGFAFIEVQFTSEGVQGSSKLVFGREELLYERNSLAKW